METSEITAIVDELVAAGTSRVPVKRLTARYPGMSVEDAYRVQNAWRERCEAAGRQLAGRKIGLTSRAMQAATGITEPDYGIIFEDMILENGATIEWEKFTHPRVEVELAFKLGKDISGPGATIFDVLDATDYVIPALEILDSRIEMEGRTIVDTISDNAANGGLVLGDGRFDPATTDLRWMGCILKRDDIVEETGLGAGVLDDPITGIIWLARRIAQYGGKLSAGDIVLSGSFIRPVEAPSGTRFVADYGAFGEVRCDFL